MTSTLSVMSLEAQKLRYGKYSLWYSDGYIWCSDGTDTYKMRVDGGSGGEIVPYDPTKDMALLPYVDVVNNRIAEKVMTVKTSINDVAVQVLTNYLYILDLQKTSQNVDKINKNLEFTDDNVNVLTSWSLGGKKITDVMTPTTTRALSDGFSLMSYEYYEAHKGELKGEKGDKGEKGEKGDTGLTGPEGEDGGLAYGWIWDAVNTGLSVAELAALSGTISQTAATVAALQAEITAVAEAGIATNSVHNAISAFENMSGGIQNSSIWKSIGNTFKRGFDNIKRLGSNARNYYTRLGNAGPDLDPVPLEELSLRSTEAVVERDTGEEVEGEYNFDMSTFEDIEYDPVDQTAPTFANSSEYYEWLGIKFPGFYDIIGNTCNLAKNEKLVFNSTQKISYPFFLFIAETYKSLKSELPSMSGNCITMDYLEKTNDDTTYTFTWSEDDKPKADRDGDPTYEYSYDKVNKLLYIKAYHKWFSSEDTTTYKFTYGFDNTINHQYINGEGGDLEEGCRISFDFDTRPGYVEGIMKMDLEAELGDNDSIIWPHGFMIVRPYHHTNYSNTIYPPKNITVKRVYQMKIPTVNYLADSYATKEDLADYATKEDIENIETGNIDLSNYATKNHTHPDIEGRLSSLENNTTVIADGLNANVYYSAGNVIITGTFDIPNEPNSTFDINQLIFYIKGEEINISDIYGIPDEYKDIISCDYESDPMTYTLTIYYTPDGSEVKGSDLGYLSYLSYQINYDNGDPSKIVNVPFDEPTFRFQSPYATKEDLNNYAPLQHYHDYAPNIHTHDAQYIYITDTGTKLNEEVIDLRDKIAALEARIAALEGA